MRVICYKNLRRGDWSIALPRGRNGLGRGQVIDHKASVILADVTLHVEECGRQRVVRNKCREVHAWAVGELVEAVPVGMATREITYNPYRCGTFTTRDGVPIERCAAVEFTATGKAIAHD